MWGRWFCGPCNGRVGVWDEEYLRWQRPIVLAIHDGPNPPRQTLLGRFENADPGAFVRCLWAWMFALDPKLRSAYPDLAHSVRFGEPVDRPSDVRLLLAATKRLDMWLSSQDGAAKYEMNLGAGEWCLSRSKLWTPSVASELIEVPLAVVSAPPFVVTLAHAGHALPGHLDTGAWLGEAPGIRRPTTLQLPMVEVVRAGVGIVTYDQIVRASFAA